MQLQFTKEQEIVKGLSVIVVDDVADSRELVEMYLKLCNAEVIAVDRARNAFELVKSFRPDIIVSDIYMPEENGYWLIDRINAINQQSKNSIKTIALTAAAREEDRKNLIEAGYDGYLAKPFILEDLTALINKLITNKNGIAEY
jgi:two-component system OmpR family response regulator